jgi:electron transfer flavoprotein beta subunit
VKILVCLKEVVDPQRLPPLDPTHRWLAELDADAYRVNRSDDCALEAALSIKDGSPGVRVEVLTVGPQRAAAMLRRALGKGADAGVHIRDDTPGYRSPQLIAARIAAVAAGRGYDLVLTGVMAEDDLQGLVGPLLAARLAWPCAVAVTDAAVDPGGRTIGVTCDLEGGRRMHAELTLPALLSMHCGSRQPRYPSLSNLLRARHQPLTTLDADDLPPVNPSEALHAIAPPARQRRCTMLSGSASAKADRLLELCYAQALLACRIVPQAATPPGTDPRPGREVRETQQ